MQVETLINKLQALLKQEGNVEVLVTNGFECECYRGEYAVEIFEDVDGSRYVDIGIGGLNEKH
jgi:hypothetical protein